MASTTELKPQTAPEHIVLPRVTIKYCTQCKWMLRAAYFAQELLSTFSTSLGEVSLIPSTGGVFTIDITHSTSQPDQEAGSKDQQATTQVSRIWDRKSEGGFPEVKQLKQLIRNIIDPTRDLGHVDRHKSGDEGLAVNSAGETPSEGPTKSSSAERKPPKSGEQDTKASDETTILTDPDAALAIGAPDEKGAGEDCKDCA